MLRMNCKRRSGQVFESSLSFCFKQIYLTIFNMFATALVELLKIWSDSHAFCVLIPLKKILVLIIKFKKGNAM